MYILILFGIAALAFIIYGIIQNKQNKVAANRREQLSQYDFKVKKEFEDVTIGVDEGQKMFIYAYWDEQPIEIYFNKILNTEVLKNNNTVHKISGTGTIVGGALAGGIGAVIGSQVGKKSKDKIESLDLLINIDDLERPTLKINFFNKGMESHKSNEALSEIEKWQGIFKIILERNKTETE